jgi:putative oxidoreductase
MKPLIEKLIAAYDAIVSKFSRPQDILLLLIRIAWGFAFFQAGWGKFGRLKDVGEFFAGLGIPAPEFNAALVASVETVGGLMLVLGLFSRLAAVPLAFNMVSIPDRPHRRGEKAVHRGLDRIPRSRPRSLPAGLANYPSAPGVSRSMTY